MILFEAENQLKDQLTTEKLNEGEGKLEYNWRTLMRTMLLRRFAVRVRFLIFSWLRVELECDMG